MTLTLLVECPIVGRQLRAESMVGYDAWAPVWCGSCHKWHPADAGEIEELGVQWERPDGDSEQIGQSVDDGGTK